MSDGIDYGRLMHRAMRGLIQEVLTDVAQNGLPGDHHFFITFDTTHPEASLADWLRERYPTEMTVVMQHWFESLDVDDDGFGVTLNFGDSPERLEIPFDAIKTFVDPSVEFGLRFESHGGEDGPTPPGPGGGKDDDADNRTAPPDQGGDGAVVRLDSFRK